MMIDMSIKKQVEEPVIDFQVKFVSAEENEQHAVSPYQIQEED